MTRWIVVGAGYTGARVVELIAARGDEVIATRRSAGPGVRALDLAAPDDLDDLFAPGDVVVVTADPTDPSARGDRALAAAAVTAGVARVVYVSSTGVYLPASGQSVDEDFALVDAHPRLAAEHAYDALPCARLRAAGIYGPGRGVIARMRAGTYRQIGDGRTASSRIHVDDLAAACVAAGDHAAPLAIYNLADDEPGPSAALVDAAIALGCAPPPTVAVTAVAPEVAAMVTADRRIDNTRLKSHLGLALRYPTWRAALAAGAC